MDNHARIPPADAQDLAGKKRPKAGQTGCPIEAWRTACISSGSMSNSENPDSHGRAFSRARDGLEKAGVLVVSGEWVWLAGQAGQGRTNA